MVVEDIFMEIIEIIYIILVLQIGGTNSTVCRKETLLCAQQQKVAVRFVRCRGVNPDVSVPWYDSDRGGVGRNEDYGIDGSRHRIHKALVRG